MLPLRATLGLLCSALRASTRIFLIMLSIVGFAGIAAVRIMIMLSIVGFAAIAALGKMWPGFAILGSILHVLGLHCLFEQVPQGRITMDIVTCLRVEGEIIRLGWLAFCSSGIVVLTPFLLGVQAIL